MTASERKYDQPIPKSFATRLSEAPVELDISQKEIANAAGITQPTYSKLANGKRDIVTKNVYNALCFAIGLNPLTQEQLEIKTYTSTASTRAMSTVIFERRRGLRRLKQSKRPYTIN